MDRPTIETHEAGGQVRVVATAHALDGEGIIRLGSAWSSDLRQAVARLQSLADRTLTDPLRTQLLRALTAHLVKRLDGG